MTINTTPSYKADLPYWCALTLPMALLFLAYTLFGLGEIGLGFHANFPTDNDIYRYVFPKMEVIKRIVESGHIPYWNPYQGFGMEMWAPLSKEPLVTFLLPFMSGVTSVVFVGCMHLIGAQLIFYVFGRQFGLSRQAACLGAMTYGMCGYFIAYVYDQSIVGTSIWIVGILASYLAWRKSQALKPLIWGAVCTGFAVSYGRPTDIVYFLAFFLAWQIQDSITDPILNKPLPDLFRTGAIMLLMGIAGLLLAAPVMFPFFHYLLEGARELATSMAEKSEYMRFDHIHGFLLPTWETGTGHFIALASTPLWLAPLLSGRLSPKVRLFGWTALIVFLIQPPFGLFDLIRLIPSQGATWTPARFTPVGMICISTLTGMGFDALFSGKKLPDRGRTIFKRSLVILTVVVAVMFVASIIMAQKHWGIWDLVGVNRKDLNLKLGMGTWIMVGLTLGAWWTALNKPRHAFIALLIAIMPATYLVNISGRAMVGTELRIDRHARLNSSQTLETLSAISDKHAFRVHHLADSMYANRTFWSGKGIHMDYSYEAAEPIEPYKNRFVLWYQGNYYRNWFNVGGFRYLIGQGKQTPEWAFAHYPLAWEDKDVDLYVFENPDHWARAFLTSNIIVEPDVDRQMVLLGEPGVVPRESAMVVSDDGLDITPGATGTVQVTEYEPSRVTLTCESNGNTLLVLSDRKASGWTATVDGREVPIIRANYMFRGVSIPDGKHEVVFTFHPPGLDAGIISGVLTAALLVALFLYDTARARRRENESR